MMPKSPDNLCISPKVSVADNGLHNRNLIITYPNKSGGRSMHDSPMGNAFRRGSTGDDHSDLDIGRQPTRFTAMCANQGVGWWASDGHGTERGQIIVEDK